MRETSLSGDSALFAFPGLWERWKDKTTGQALETYKIITTDRNELMEPIHNRMPVILRRQDYDRWLAPEDGSQLPVDLLRSFPAEETKA
ncbi:MAG: SOS response-associated peptidase family protein [Terracidiphilus sp.]